VLYLYNKGIEEFWGAWEFSGARAE